MEWSKFPTFVLFHTGKKDIDSEPKEKNPFASTILLPDTPFSQRANAAVREPEIQAYWKETKLYDKLSQAAEKSGGPVVAKPNAIGAGGY